LICFIFRVIATKEAISRNEGCGATCSCVFVFARVARGCSFFGGKEMNQRKPLKSMTARISGVLLLSFGATVVPG